MKGDSRRPGLVRARSPVGLGVAFMFLVALTGCTVTLLSAYDAGTDQMTTALQRSVAGHLETLAEQQAPACYYENYRAFYVQQHVDVGALALRVNAIPKNQPTIAQVSDLKMALTRFETAHKLASARNRCLTVGEIQPDATGFDVYFRAILTLEIGKQRGMKPAS